MPDERAPGWVERLGRRLAAVTIEGWITFGIVVGAVVFTLAQLHPDLLFSNSTPTGGDMGAHVWAPAYLRDHLLPHFRLSGWAPDWYAGFPAYQFYMVIPALAVVILDVVLPYGLALKLVSIAGVLTLPIAAWAFGKLSGLRFPAPPMFAAIAVVFLFDETFTIYGGNIASTMAGEFSFSIALSLSLVYFGVLARGLRTGRHRALAAGLLALCVLSHLIVAIFAAAGTIVWFLLYLDRHRFKWLATTLPVAMLLTAFWIVPFWMRRHYLTDMGYERRTDYVNMLFPSTWKWDAVILVLGVIGLLAAIVRRQRTGIWLGLMTLIYGVWIIVWPQSMFWNARLTPFYYLCKYLLAALGAVEIGLWLASIASRLFGRGARRAVIALTPVVGALICAVVLGMSLRILPGGHMVTLQTSTGPVSAYSWLGLTNTKSAFVDDWAKWNYLGYEGKPAYGEYRGVMSTMDEIGQTRGCGRAEWEYDSELNQYGTPMSMMLLPFWTDGCIGSMEGLFFESSATTPYHFLASSALSAAPSRPVRNLRYDPLDVPKGVQYMQLLGVRYYMAFSPAAVKMAREDEGLTEIATLWAVGDLRGRRFRDRVLPRERTRGGRGRGQGLEELVARRGGLLPRPGDVERRTRRERPRRMATHPGRPGARGATAPARRGHQHHHRRRPHQLRRRSGRGAGARQGLVLPELASIGRRRPVAGHAQPHGRRTHERARVAPLRAHTHRSRRHLPDPARLRRTHLADPQPGARLPGSEGTSGSGAAPRRRLGCRSDLVRPTTSGTTGTSGRPTMTGGPTWPTPEGTRDRFSRVPPCRST